MTAADCPLAIADIAADPLQGGRVLSCFPALRGLVPWFATTAARRGVGKPVHLSSGILLAVPWALPGYSLLLSMRNRQVYE